MKFQRAGAMAFVFAALLMSSSCATGFSGSVSDLPEVRGNPPAPAPERIEVSALPLPPTAPSSDAGSCTRQINPRGTGCIDGGEYGIQEGPAYMWDGRHVLLNIMFAGAPASSRDPASRYSGSQVIAIRTDGTLFSNGDAWRCITCGVSEENAAGAYRPRPGGGGASIANLPERFIPLDHPQAFHGDRRMIAGTNVVDCGEFSLADERCTPDRVHIYPIRFSLSDSPSPGGFGGGMREIRLHPDSEHIGFSVFVPARSIEQFTFYGRLAFVPAAGAERAHYELRNLNILLDRAAEPFQFQVDPNDPERLVFAPLRVAIGEFRGWSSDGQSIFGNFWRESGNVDMFRTDLLTGESVRITRDPAYSDPMKASPDDQWNVVMDARQGGRHMYFAAMRGVPPLIDLVTQMTSVCCYNDGNRRFFQPYLLDAYGDRGDYHGQQINAGPGTPGSPSDPNWNGRADPAWSPDGTNIVYWQALVTAPSCDAPNRQPCPSSTEPGGRRTRLMIARLLDREPVHVEPAALAPDVIPWALPFRTGDPIPVRPTPAPAGRFTLYGAVSGRAEVEIRHDEHGAINFVSAAYTRYTDDGVHIIDGEESAERMGEGFGARIVWHSNLRASGLQNGVKVTSEPDGFVPPTFGFGPNRPPTEGSLTTTIDGVTYTAPPR